MSTGRMQGQPPLMIGNHLWRWCTIGQGDKELDRLEGWFVTAQDMKGTIANGIDRLLQDPWYALQGFLGSTQI